MNRVSKGAYYKNIKTNEVYKLVRIKRDNKRPDKRKPIAFLAKLGSNELVIIKVSDLKRSSVYQEAMNPVDTAKSSEVNGVYSLNNNHLDDATPKVKTLDNFEKGILNAVEPTAKRIARIAKRMADGMRGAVKR